MIPANVSPPTATREHFLALFPRIEEYARLRFTWLRCPGLRDDAIAETVACTWRRFVRLAEMGADPERVWRSVVEFAVRDVTVARNTVSGLAPRDALSWKAQQKGAFHTEGLGFLVDATRMPIPDMVAFKVDFEAWLSRLSERDREMVTAMMEGADLVHAGRQIGVGPGRAKNMRTALRKSWETFQED